MSPGLTRGAKKGFRTVVQVAAGGALTALVTALAGGLAPTTQAVVMGAWIAFVAFSQNWAEGAGKMRVLLPTPALIPMTDEVGAVLAPVAGTVEAVADEAGKVTGDVVEAGGGIVGRVVGRLRRDHNDEDGAGLIVFIVLAVLLMVGLFVTCDMLIDDESEPGDNHLLGRVELVSHDYDDGYDDDDDGGGQEYDQWNGNDRNRNRNRNRGAFSPGPFDDSPVDAFNNVCMPGATCHYDGDRRNNEREMP